jgi:predicted RNA binding protein YcfA (HicA-like mRNA interferase family)
MKYAELARKLRRLGCYPTRFGAGSHEIWRNPATQTQVPIPYHRTKEREFNNCPSNASILSGARRTGCPILA